VDGFNEYVRGTFSSEDTKKSNSKDYRASVATSFYFTSPYLFGIPERADSFLLKATEHGDPYRLYNLDVFQHYPFSPQALYGSIPYMTSHGVGADAGLLWVNSAETWVDIYEIPKNQTVNGKLTTWLSESGKLEFFLMAGSTPSQVSRSLALVTGFPAFMPYFTLGFHYSKWEDISTNRMLDIN